MNTSTKNEHNENEKRHHFVLASFLRIGFLALLIVASFMIIKPFILAMFWGIIIAVGIYPIFKKLAKLLGNRGKLAAIIIVVAAFAIIIIPSVIFTSNTVDTLTEVVKDLIQAH